MPTTFNVLTKADSFYQYSATNQQLSPSTYSHAWTATNATLVVTSEEYVYPLQYSLKIQPTVDQGNVVVNLTNITSNLEDLFNQSFQFHARYKSSSALNIQTSITNNQTQQTNLHTDTSVPLQWSTGYSPVMSAGGTAISYDIQITISNHFGAVIYLSLPSLVNDDGFYQNSFVSNLRKNIPSFIWDRDTLSTFPTYPFFKLFHVLTYAAHESAQVYSNIFKYSQEQIAPAFSSADNFTKSELVDFDFVKLEYSDWLGQFTGQSIKRNINVGGTNIIEALAVDADDFVEWQLDNAYFGRAAGTVDAIRSCAQQVLTGSQICFVFSGGSAFAILIYTLLDQTPGVVNNGDTSAEVTEILELTKPLGFTFTHQAFTALPFLLNDPIYGLLDIAPLA